jgi:hypothetical protein
VGCIKKETGWLRRLPFLSVRQIGRVCFVVFYLTASPSFILVFVGFVLFRGQINFFLGEGHL